MVIAWKNLLCLLAALWLWLSPFVLQFHLGSEALPDASVSGVLIGLITVVALARPQIWEDWLRLGLSAWLIASPWLLGFGHLAVGRNDVVITGVIIGALSLWSLMKPDEPRSGLVT